MNMQHELRRRHPAPAPFLRRSAFTLVELLVVIGIIAVLIGILVPVASRARESANRAKCASNLRSIGQMLVSYSNGNKGNYPRTFFDNKKVPMTFQDAAPPVSPPWFATGATVSVPFGSTKPGPTGPNNVPAGLFLLIRTQDVSPEAFICPSAGDAIRDNFGGGSNSAKSRSNFTQLPTNLSFSYANPYPDAAASALNYRLNNEVINEFVVAADMNPGKSGTYDVTAVSEGSASADLRKGNSANHKGAGQNVLYGDGRVSFETTPFCGKNRDNIYTVAGSTDGKVTTSPTIVGSPAWQWDSVLLPAMGK
jgi:prepilin-type N-terminal cleavage/methylation domain-containing protein